jgi:hypothetical protein
MPHYYFDLTDGATRRDPGSLGCTDDAEAIVMVTTKEVLAAVGDSSHAGLSISIIHDGREVSRGPLSHAY